MTKKRLLIAEDNALMHEIYAGRFGADFELHHAYDGAEALMMAVGLRPDLLLLDIMMPLLDGRTICRKLKQNPATAGIKIVLVTAKDAQSDRIVGFEVGADDYIEKTCSLEFIERKVRRLLEAESRPEG